MQLVRMPAFTENPEFLGEKPKGICSVGMSKKAGILFCEGDGKDDELLPLVVASGVLETAAKVKMQFGHQVPKQVAEHHGASSPFHSTPAVLHSALTDKLTNWNPPAVATPAFALARLHQLRSVPVGYPLSVVSHWNSTTQQFGGPVIGLTSAPSVGTPGLFADADPPGLNLHDSWDISQPTLSAMPAGNNSCPLLVHSGGLSRRVNPPDCASVLAETAPLFIPRGQKLAGTVTIGDFSYLNSWFFPTSACAPIGLAWKLGTLAADALQRSVQALVGCAPKSSPCAPFAHSLVTLEPLLEDWWLLAVQAESSLFALEAFLFTNLDDHFPCLTTGAFPPSILCHETFHDFMHMRSLCVWRLCADKLPSSALREDSAFFRTYLSRTAPCLHADTCLHAALPTELTPNIPFNFPVHGGWPTDTLCPLKSLARPEVASSRARRYEPIPIEVRLDQPAPSIGTQLTTSAQASARKHAALTPKHSQVPADDLAVPFRSPSCAAIPRTSQNSPLEIRLPPSCTTARRSPRRTQSSPGGGTNLSTSNVCSPTQTLAKPLASLASRRSKRPNLLDILDWLLSTLHARDLCSTGFKQTALLLCHGLASLDPNQPRLYRPATALTQADYFVLAREPCSQWRTKLFVPLHADKPPTGIVDIMHTYVRTVVDIDGENYFATYFTGQFFHSDRMAQLVNPTTWDMTEGFDPAHPDTGGFTVCDFIPILKRCSAHPALIPATGLSCLDMKSFSHSILAWFRSMDVDLVGEAPPSFNSSLLGTAASLASKNYSSATPSTPCGSEHGNA
jgi:hypothetical protein